MLKHLLSTKMFIAACIFFLLCVGGSLLYYQHEVRLANQQLAATTAFFQRINERSAARATHTTEAQTRNVPSESIEHTMPSTDAFEEPLEVTDTLSAEDGTVDFEEIPLSDETLQLERGNEAVRPADADAIPKTEQELKTLVEQKLLEQGIPVRASFMENGLVYPLIRNVVYVEWDAYVQKGRVVRYISLSRGIPEDVDLLNAIHRERKTEFSARDIPPHMRLIPYGEGGIDPYQFLGLDR